MSDYFQEAQDQAVLAWSFRSDDNKQCLELAIADLCCTTEAGRWNVPTTNRLADYYIFACRSEVYDRVENLMKFNLLSFTDALKSELDFLRERLIKNAWFPGSPLGAGLQELQREVYSSFLKEWEDRLEKLLLLRTQAVKAKAETP